MTSSLSRANHGSSAAATATEGGSNIGAGAGSSKYFSVSAWYSAVNISVASIAIHSFYANAPSPINTPSPRPRRLAGEGIDPAAAAC